MENQHVVINNRYHGPTDSGNGGYVCGVVANFIDKNAEVMLRKPPPLDKLLTVVVEETAVRLIDGETIIAEGHETPPWHLEAPEAPTLTEAQAAAANFVGPEDHIFPSCFVCGPVRKQGDGMQIFAAPVAGRPLAATPWYPYPELADENGLVKSEFIWAALDCPGGAAVIYQIGLKPIVLGKLAVQIVQPVVVDSPHIVTGWLDAEDGRKYKAGTAVYTESGNLCAIGKATWIALR